MITDREAAIEQREAASYGAAVERARRPNALVWSLVGALAVIVVVGALYMLTRNPSQGQLTPAEAAQVQASIDQSNLSAQSAAQQASLAAQSATVTAVQNAQTNAAVGSAATDAAVSRAQEAANRANQAAARADAAPAPQPQPQPQSDTQPQQ